MDREAVVSELAEIYRCLHRLAALMPERRRDFLGHWMATTQKLIVEVSEGES